MPGQAISATLQEAFVQLVDCPPIFTSISEPESRMVITEVVLFVIWQIIPVVPAACFSQPVLSPNVEQEHDSAEDTKPDEAET